jgi:hypothetical protein
MESEESVQLIGAMDTMDCNSINLVPIVSYQFNQRIVLFLLSFIHLPKVLACIA